MGPKRRQGPHFPGQDRVAEGRGDARSLVKSIGLSANKRLGQHFLVSDQVVASIVSRAAHAKSVLEIGPGVGVLTKPLSEQSSVTAIELDDRFVEVLAKVAPLATVIKADALKADLRDLLSAMPEPRCIVSNMPYNITGPLLQRVCDCRDLLDNAVLMMQKEVGLRVQAKPGTSERGALSVSMQLQFEIKKVCDAKAGAFMPPPKVDSIVLEFVPREQGDDLGHTLEVVRAGFVQPRKTLVNNLAKNFDASKVGLPASIRPHQLTNEEWVSLARRL